MRGILLAAGMACLLSTSAMAEVIGVTMSRFDDNFLTVLRNGMQKYSRTLDGVELQIEDAQNDVGKQLNQIQNFIAGGVDAIVVNPVDTDATLAISRAAANARIPLVYVNREPVNVDRLPAGQAFVGSDERQSGTLQTQEICRLLKQQGKGKGARVVVMMGELSNQAARQRTQDIRDVIGTSGCSFMKIVEQQTANWQRNEGRDLMSNWLSAGLKFDAVISNNDEMAIGAIQAMKAARVSMQQMLVGGVDATQDALAAMKAGDLDVTVFQDAAGQAKGTIDAAVALARGRSVEKKIYVPFQLVTPSTLEKFVTRN